MDILEYLKSEYDLNEPIPMKDIDIPGMSNSAIRKAMKRLVDSGKLRRARPGVYYIPKQTLFGKSTISADSVAVHKYITDRKTTYGLYTGLRLMNEARLTTQVPNTIEILTNNEATRKRTVEIGNRHYILRKAPVEVTSDNVELLRLIEVIKSDYFMDLDMEEQHEVIERLVQKPFSRELVQQVLASYPDYVSKRFIETGAIYEIA